MPDFYISIVANKVTSKTSKDNLVLFLDALALVSRGSFRAYFITTSSPMFKDKSKNIKFEEEAISLICSMQYNKDVGFYAKTPILKFTQVRDFSNMQQVISIFSKTTKKLTNKVAEDRKAILSIISRSDLVLGAHANMHKGRAVFALRAASCLHVPIIDLDDQETTVKIKTFINEMEVSKDKKPVLKTVDPRIKFSTAATIHENAYMDISASLNNRLTDVINTTHATLNIDAEAIAREILRQDRGQ